jgi:hypothetical protein
VGTGGAVNAALDAGCASATEDPSAITITPAVAKYRKQLFISCPFHFVDLLWAGCQPAADWQSANARGQELLH